MYQVKAEKTIAKPVGDVFNALKGGRLFMNCGANSESLQIDFRVGGQYRIDFRNKTLVNFGEFLEIIPNKKIVFTWCQTFGADQKPDTQVTIDLFEDGGSTKMVLLHTGFMSQEVADGHEGGWRDGANDFANEVQNGRLRMVRSFAVPIEKLYAACQNLGDLASEAQLLESAPNKKITLSLKAGSATLSFNKKDENTCAVEVVHEGLENLEQQLAYRTSWEKFTKKLNATLT